MNFYIDNTHCADNCFYAAAEYSIYKRSIAYFFRTIYNKYRIRYK